jgi:hypothetical protein
LLIIDTHAFTYKWTQHWNKPTCNPTWHYINFISKNGFNNNNNKGENDTNALPTPVGVGHQ